MITNLTMLDFLLSITASLISSVIFIFLLLLWLRPNVKISPVLCQQKDTFDSPSCRDCYLFKVVNLSWFSAYDISVELSSLVSYPVKDGMNFRFFPLTLKVDKLNFIAPYRPRWFKKNYGEYAMLFRTYENLREILDNERNSIKIQVTLRHGLTGLSKVYNMDYVNCSDVKKGHFAFGKNFNVV
jgi:hypothetical protein